MDRGSQGNGINKSQGMEKAKGALDALKDVQEQNGKQSQAFRRVTQFIGFNKNLTSTIARHIPVFECC